MEKNSGLQRENGHTSSVAEDLVAVLAGTSPATAVARAFEHGCRVLLAAADLVGAQELHALACTRLAREYAAAVASEDAGWLIECRARSAALAALGQALARAQRP